MRASWLLVVACLGCATPRTNSPSLLQQLKAHVGAHVVGKPVALGEKRILNREDFVYDAKWSTAGDAVALSRLGARGFFLSVHAVNASVPLDVLVNGVASDVESIEFSPDGAHVAAASRDGFLRIFSANTGQLESALQADEPLVCLAWHAAGTRIAIGGARGTVAAVEFPSGRVLTRQTIHSDEVRGLAFLGDGSLVSGGWDKHLVVLKATESSNALQVVRDWTLPGAINDISVDAAGTVAGVALSEMKAERTPRVYEQEKRNELPRSLPQDCAARVDLQTGELLETQQGQRGPVVTVGISPDGKTLAFGGWDKTLRVQGALALFDTDFGWALRRVRFSPNGRQLAVAAWTPQNPLGNHQSAPSAVVYELVYASDATVGF